MDSSYGPLRGGQRHESMLEAAFSGEVAVRASRALSNALKFDVGNALALLRFVQGVLSTFTTLALMQALELLQWALAGRDNGVSSVGFLGVAPTTTITGVASIVTSKVSRLHERFWGICRLVLVAAIWVPGIILFVRANVVTAYETAMTYDVTAGVGQFKGEYVQSYTNALQAIVPEYNFTVVPSSILKTAYSLAGNSMHLVTSKPVHCDGCDSYLMTGGMLSTTPWPPQGHDGYSMINLKNVPASQIEFRRGIAAEDAFTDEDCSQYGDKSFLIGIKVCVAKSKSYPGFLAAGLFVCPRGTDDGRCDGQESRPNLTATMSVYERTADVVSARFNFSIMSVSNLSPPKQNMNIDVEAYRKALDWFLDFKAAGIPAPASSAEYFWNAQEQLASDYYSGDHKNTFQSILSFPLWLFQDNNYGNINLKMKDMVMDLPRQHYVKARVTKPYAKIVIDQNMFVAFMILQGAALFFIWAILVWLWIARPLLPRISSYPLVDFAFKAKAGIHERDGGEPEGEMVFSGDSDIRRQLRNDRITLRARPQ
ncbi:hypothetical protein P154DRAFT_551439 [Amniculicola lignicola CBS 123094]|uniref:Uncharacterized protein n=1 Tax=Amniculicola lignicola CBS 123094 TaxID=1392246 RepID=A0A6A5WXA9_9PLEO|nr:hypothetical protein P154DRAFT_551439 [Amniculicola lignicola CBS 123094]